MLLWGRVGSSLATPLAQPGSQEGARAVAGLWWCHPGGSPGQFLPSLNLGWAGVAVAFGRSVSRGV